MPDVRDQLIPPDDTPALYAQERVPDATVWAHYFIGGCDWLLTEYDPGTGRAFGWAVLNGDLQNAELGYFDLEELSEIGIPIRLNGIAIGEHHVELDEQWRPIPLSEAKAEIIRRHGWEE